MKFKIFFINLEDNPQPWIKAQNLFALLPDEIHDCVERIDAVDTRQSLNKLNLFDLELKPIGIDHKLYFSQHPGATGCFLSHYVAWKKIIDEQIDFALILEDDVVLSDVLIFLLSNPDLDSNIDLLNLNARNNPNQHHSQDLNGSESYVLSNSGAQKLIKIIKQPSILHKKIKPLSIFPKSFLKKNRNKIYSKEDFKTCNSIIAPVDKFLGYSTSFDLEKDFGLSYKYFPVIDLCKSVSEHSSITANLDSYVNFRKKDFLKFISSDKFLFWEKEYSVSLCICTFDNYKQLMNTLESALMQDFDSKKYEIIVLDNTTNEKHAEYIKYNHKKIREMNEVVNFCKKNKLIRYFHIPSGCLSKARNDCVKLSSKDLIYFVDDDVTLNESSVKNISLEFKEHSNISIVGGQVICKWPDDSKPSWINEQNIKYYSHLDHGEKSDLVNNNLSYYLVGANLCFRSSFFKENFGFREDLGRKNNSLLSGEEDELINQAIQKNHFVKYSANCKIFHNISASRCTKNWLLKRVAWQEITNIFYRNNHNIDINLVKNEITKLLDDDQSIDMKCLLISNLIQLLLFNGGAMNQKIPKIIHQIHLGTKPLSSLEKKWQSTWLKNNPEWEYILWDDQKIESLEIINQDALKSCKNFSEKSDVLRFEILYKFGGLYVDTDFECLKSLDTFFADKDFIICRQTPYELCGAFLACTPQHPIMQKIMDNIPNRLAQLGYQDFGEQTSTIKYGPVYLTEILGVDIGLDPFYVYPYLWGETHRARENFALTSPRSYAVHHWAGNSLIVDNLNFKKAFVISISPKKAEKYKNIKFIETFEGIDTRNDFKEKLDLYGFKAEVEERWARHFYETSAGNGSGAFGCSLSHMSLWKKIAQQKDDSWYLILEDDACVEDIVSFSEDRSFNGENYDLINLNNRPKPWGEFDGSDAYLIKPKTAQKLLNFCGNTISAPLDKVLFHLDYFRKYYNINYVHYKKIGMAPDWKDSCLS